MGVAAAAAALGTTSVAGAGGSVAATAGQDRGPVVQTQSALGNGLGRLVAKPGAAGKTTEERQGQPADASQQQPKPQPDKKPTTEEKKPPVTR